MASTSQDSPSPSGHNMNERSNGVPPKDPPSPIRDGGEGRDNKVPKNEQKETIIWRLCQIDQFRDSFQNRGLLTRLKILKRKRTEKNGIQEERGGTQAMTANNKTKSKKKGNDSLPEIFDLERLEGEHLVLRGYVRSLSAIKTLNEVIHNATYIAKLKPTPVYLEYDGQETKTITENGVKKQVTKKVKKTKTLYLETYLVKGLKGLLRHLLMVLLDALGISSCHSTERSTYGKDEQSVIPDGSFVHPLGACVREDGKTRQEGCLTYQIFGGMLEQSIIKVDQVLIVQANGNIIPKTAKVIKPSRKVVFAHIATEARNVMTIEQKPIQEFREHYFDTDFVLSIDVTQCTIEQLGALIEALFHAKELGGSKTAGYGKIVIDRVDLQGIEEKRQVSLTENGFEIQTTTQERSLPTMLQEAFMAWEAYKEAHRTIHKAAKPTDEVSA